MNTKHDNKICCKIDFFNNRLISRERFDHLSLPNCKVFWIFKCNVMILSEISMSINNTGIMTFDQHIEENCLQQMHTVIIFYQKIRKSLIILSNNNNQIILIM